jgi:hypothetical protein
VIFRRSHESAGSCVKFKVQRRTHARITALRPPRPVDLSIYQVPTFFTEASSQSPKPIYRRVTKSIDLQSKSVASRTNHKSAQSPIKRVTIMPSRDICICPTVPLHAFARSGVRSSTYIVRSCEWSLAGADKRPTHVPSAHCNLSFGYLHQTCTWHSLT